MNLKSLHRILNKYDNLKQNKLYTITRKFIFPFMLKAVSKLFQSKIDDKLIVMSAYGGYEYLDNTKYLFEFLNRYSDYKLVWITRSQEILNKIRKKGYKAVYIYDLEAIRLLRKAKFIFITHGYVDILPIEFSSGTIVIFTWHGTPIKKMDESPIYDKWSDFLHLKLKYDQYVDYILTPTKDKREHKILSKAFKLSLKKILPLGYPKLDLLFNKDENFIAKLKKSHQIPDNIDRIILYCPTYRQNFTLNFPFEAEHLKKLNNLLENTNSLFLIKAHMFVKNIKIIDYRNIKVITKTANIEELYLITDILITDYSSTMLDFSLLNRPILLFPYDHDEYLKEIGLYYNLEDIAPGPIFLDADNLIKSIKNISQIDKDYKEKRIRIRDRFNKHIDGKSTERLLDFLKIDYRRNI